MGRVRRSIVIGTVAEFTTRRLAMHALSERLRLLNSGRQRPQPMRTLTDFVQKDWEPVVLPTLKYATQKHYKYILKAHLIPAFGEFRLPDISREAIQNFLLTKLREDYSWESPPQSVFLGRFWRCGASFATEPPNAVFGRLAALCLSPYSTRDPSSRPLHRCASTRIGMTTELFSAGSEGAQEGTRLHFYVPSERFSGPSKIHGTS